uniref:L1 transposable element RRM domain-containing protein n=1 Tax=Monodelphis domestica TaxID=13616 RepID=A0A5F8GSV8_MONDO
VSPYKHRFSIFDFVNCHIEDRWSPSEKWLQGAAGWLSGLRARPRDNLIIIGLQEDHDKRKSLDIILQEIIQENFPDILEQEGKVEIERIHRSAPVFNPQLTTPRNVIVKFKNYQTKKKILQAAKKKSFTYHGNTVRITQDLAASTLKDQKAWNMIFWKAMELGLQQRIKYPSKPTIFLQGKVWSFNTIEEFQTFVKKRPDLNRKFDVQAQNSRESSKGTHLFLKWSLLDLFSRLVFLKTYFTFSSILSFF